MENDIRLGTPTAVFGVTEAHKYLISCLPQYKILYITADGVSADKAHASISALSGRKCVLLPAKDEVILYKDALSKDALFRRLTAVSEISNGADIVVCDIEAVMQLFPADAETLNFTAGEETDFTSVPAKLVEMGYTREYSVESKGSFAVRGDILDIYPINCENPVRIDFFGDAVERIRPYDSVSGERLDEVSTVSVISATDARFNKKDVDNIKAQISKSLKSCADSASYKRAKAICDDLITKLEGGAPFAGASFVLPLISGTRTIFDLLDKNTLIIFDECKLINDRLNGVYKEHIERVRELKKGGEAFDFSAGQLLSPQTLTENFSKYRSMAVQTFTSGTQFFKPLRTYNFTSSPAPSYLNAMPQLITDVKNWLSNGYRILIYTGGIQRSEKLSEILGDEYLPVYPLPDRYSSAVCQPS